MHETTWTKPDCRNFQYRTSIQRSVQVNSCTFHSRLTFRNYRARSFKPINLPCRRNMLIPSKYLIRFIAILITILLCGCATLPAGPAARDQYLSWQQRVKQLQAIDTWQLDGVIGISIPHQAWSGSIRWQQVKSHFSFDLFGPLGVGRVSLISKPGYSQLAMASGKKFTASNPDELLFKATGWRLPVGDLYYWVRGLPLPGFAAKTQFDQFNHLIKLQQRGWEIQYLRYTSVHGIDVPSKIFLQYQTLKIRMVISRWII